MIKYGATFYSRHTGRLNRSLLTQNMSWLNPHSTEPVSIASLTTFGSVHVDIIITTGLALLIHLFVRSPEQVFVFNVFLSSESWSRLHSLADTP